MKCTWSKNLNQRIASKLLPAGILAGSIVGAGIFSLPFVFFQVGVVSGLIYLFIVAIVVAVSHLLYADLIIRSGVRHNFVGYCRYYLGRSGYWLAILMSVVQMLLVLLIYLVLSQSFFKLLVGQTSFAAVAVFWLIGSAAVFFSLRRLAGVESAITFFILAIVLLLFLRAVPQLPALKWGDFSLSFSNFLMAAGPLFFALSGRVAIVEVVRSARYSAAAKKAAIWGTMVPAAAYAVFALAVIVLSSAVSPDAVSGLAGMIDDRLLAGIGLLGLLSILSSYFVVSFDVNNILQLDLHWGKFWRLAAIIGLPMVFYLAGWRNFLLLVSFTGGVFGALTFIFIMLMWLKAVNRRPWWAFFLLLFFVLVFIDQIAGFVFN